MDVRQEHWLLVLIPPTAEAQWNANLPIMMATLSITDGCIFTVPKSTMLQAPVSNDVTADVKKGADQRCRIAPVPGGLDRFRTGLPD